MKKEAVEKSYLELATCEERSERKRGRIKFLSDDVPDMIWLSTFWMIDENDEDRGIIFANPYFSCIGKYVRNPWNQYYKTIFDFDALCEMLSEFSSGHICACY